MERAIDLRLGKLPELRVVNMSLGGATLFPGGDVYQSVVDAMAQAGISLSISAGNNGPAGVTVATPGTSKNILTVAAANNATYARIAYYNSTGQDGYLSRPDDSEQVANFSSRGPNSDGRVGPGVIANGQNTFVQGPDNSLSLGSGTSFSAPVISGILALLYNFKHSANPGEVRAAVMLGARFDQIPTATVLDQGRGYVDAVQTVKILATSPDPIPDEAPAQRSASRNIEIATGQPVIDESSFQREISDLRPSERRELYFLVERETRSFTLTVPEVTMELPPEQQNPLFGDRLLLAVHSAKLSAHGSGGDYLYQAYLPLTGFSQTLTNLEPGILRITFMASQNNVGRVAHSALVGEEERGALPRPRFRGEVAPGESRVHTVEVPKGVYVLRLELYWPDDWSVFPANDLDMIITTPSGDVDTQGMSLRNPEISLFDRPEPGAWSLQIQGTTIYRGAEPYEVRVTMQ